MFNNLNVSPFVVQAFAKRWRNRKLLNIPTDVRHVIQTKHTRWRNTHHATGAISQPIFILQLSRCIYCAIHQSFFCITNYEHRNFSQTLMITPSFSKLISNAKSSQHMANLHTTQVITADYYNMHTFLVYYYQCCHSV